MLKNTFYMIVSIRFLLFIFFVVFSFDVFSQDISLDKFDKNIFNDKKDFRNTKKKLENADNIFSEAISSEFLFIHREDLFLLALKDYIDISSRFNDSSSDLCLKIAFSFLFTNNKQMSEFFLNKAYNLNKNQPPEYFFVLARNQQLNMYFDSAIDNYNIFRSKVSADEFQRFRSIVFKYIDECESGKNLVKNHAKAWVDNVEDINTEGNEINPCITADGENMFFSFQSDFVSDSLICLDCDYDIMSASIKSRKWTNIKSLSNFNTSDNDEVISNISYDGQRLLFFKDVSENNTDIFQSKLRGDVWSDPVLKMSKNINTVYNETFSCYTPGDRTIYYLIDVNKHKDITFSAAKDIDESSWILGQTVSNLINTKFNEGSVFVSQDGKKMYFSSEGHDSMGGYDIFVSYLDENNKWSRPVNLGYPVNTPYDDLFFSSTASGKYAFISSNRKDSLCKGNLDIYKITFFGEPKNMFNSFEDQLVSSLEAPVKEQYAPKQVTVSNNNLTVFKGKIFDAVTNEPVEALIQIYNNKTGELISRFNSNSSTGKFLLSLPSGFNYGISVELDDYLFYSENFNLPQESEFNIVEKNIKMMKIKKGSKITLKNVFFDFDKHSIKPESYPELDRLSDLLLEFVNIKVELSGHTDNIGSEKYNKRLSQKRSDEVKKYLIGKGVDKGQVKSKGYGSDRPIYSNDSEEGRSKNRRTEFEILDN